MMKLCFNGIELLQLLSCAHGYQKIYGLVFHFGLFSHPPGSPGWAAGVRRYPLVFAALAGLIGSRHAEVAVMAPLP
jgi:hypothetical protein